jgi:hypothetical protein
MSPRRIAVAAVVLAAWTGGVVALVRREYFRPNVERLAEAAARVNPGAVFYTVMQGDRQIGFASSTIDTAAKEITAVDYLVADVPVAGGVHRMQARTTVGLSRGLRVRHFDVDITSDGAPVRASGTVDGDSVILLQVASGPGASRVARRLPINGPILLPSLAPLALALGQEPHVGKSYLFQVFDPAVMAAGEASLSVRAESTFVVNDSSVFDSTSGRYRAVLPVPIHAWRMETEGGSGFAGWVDEQGRVVQTTTLGLRLERRPYEVAFENWRIENAANGTAAAADRDILGITAITAGKKLTRELPVLRVRLLDTDLKGFDINGGRQTLRGDTLTIMRESPDSVAPMPLPSPAGQHWNAERVSRSTAGGGPRLIMSSPPAEIRRLTRRILAPKYDPALNAARINQWVHDSLVAKTTAGVPDALHVLRSLSGDCNEHTLLFIAMARSAGIPARAAAGLVYIDGKFYYHAWPEVFLRGWVAVDPTFGQFPADAAHLRFTIGSLEKQDRLFRLINSLRIDVLPAQSAPSPALRP